MEFISKTGKPESARYGCVIVAVHPGLGLSASAAALDAAAGGRLASAVAHGDLGAGIGRCMMLYDLPGVNAPRVLAVNAGDTGALTDADFRKTARGALTTLLASESRQALWCLAELQVPSRGPAWPISESVLLASRETYRFTEYRSDPADNEPMHLERLAVQVPGELSRPAAKRALAAAEPMALGVATARRLGDLPGNVCTPDYLAEQGKTIAARYERMSAKVLDERRMRQLGMGAFLSVTAGTEQPAKLIALDYRGGAKADKPTVLIGKGITFDTGGISIKPGPAMDEMKFDMCGAASVLGTLEAVARLELPINVVGLVAAAENMPSGSASRPGDIVETMSGQTVEILNTDAEGRLVLCDTLTYAERYEPSAVIDIATLTGAALIALGNHATALYASDEQLADALISAGENTGDRAWRMPLWDDYQQQLHSNFADMANVGGREAGSVTAACFLSRFAKRYPWAHLDIAGTGWLSGAKKGATGRPVSLLVQYLSDVAVAS